MMRYWLTVMVVTYNCLEYGIDTVMCHFPDEHVEHYGPIVLSCNCRGVLITDSVTSPFTTIYIVYSSTPSIGGHGDKQKKVLKGPISLTDSDQIWHTPRRERDTSTLRFSRSQNSPNSKKCDFSPKFQKFISRKRAEIFSPNFRDL